MGIGALVPLALALEWAPQSTSPSLPVISERARDPLPETRHRDEPRGAPRFHPCEVVLPSPDRRPREQPAVHPPGRVRGGDRLRTAAVRLPRDRHVAVVRLQRLAIDERDALPHDDRRDERAHPPSLGRDRRRARRAGRRDRGLADAARATGRTPALACGWPALPDPGDRRWHPDPDRSLRLEPDAPSRPRRVDLGGHGGSRGGGGPPRPPRGPGRRGRPGPRGGWGGWGRGGARPPAPPGPPPPPR